MRKRELQPKQIITYIGSRSDFLFGGLTPYLGSVFWFFGFFWGWGEQKTFV